MYLGYQIGQGGVRPEINRAGITTRDQAGCEIFFGNDSYDCLTELTRKNMPEKIEWTEGAELAFQRLKMLVSAPLLKNPDFTRTFILQTDASGVGVGA